jgi:hypothetical protein
MARSLAFAAIGLSSMCVEDAHEPIASAGGAGLPFTPYIEYEARRGFTSSNKRVA